MRYSVLQFVLPTNTRVAVCCSLKKYTCCSVPIHVLQCANTRVAVCCSLFYWPIDSLALQHVYRVSELQN